MKINLLLTILIIGCSHAKQSEKTTKIVDSVYTQFDKLLTESSDTCFLEKTEINDKLLALDDDGNLSIDSLDIKLVLNENKKESYDLELFSKGEKKMFKNNIQGISRVLVNKNYIMFSIYQTFTEDGQNQGYPLIYSLKDDKILTTKKSFENTSNPVLVNDKVYLVENLQLFILDKGFKQIQKIPIIYEPDEKNIMYLDTYLICGVNLQNKDLEISFSPNKSQKTCTLYKGIFNIDSKHIKLIEK